MNSAVLWEGETQLPGQTGRVAAIITGINGSSKNRKTGAMPQVWYIPTDQGHLVGGDGAVMTGRDSAVCGTCKHRPSQNGVCYVIIARGPQRIWHTYQRDGYPRPPLGDIREALRGKTVRFGAYGEPPSIPRSVYGELLPVLAGWQGYTHAWTQLQAAEWGFLMASTDTRVEKTEARARGWRTFHVRLPGEPVDARERVCPASAEAGYKATCLQCGACNGDADPHRAYVHAPADGRPGRVIVAHGFRAGRFARAARQLRLFLGV